MALPALLQVLSQKMAYLTQRSAVLGENIANANTQGYKPKDLVDFSTALQQASSSGQGGVKVAVTHAGHIGGPGGADGPYKTRTEKDFYEIKPSGNAVILEQQMAQLSQTSTNYAATAGLYKKVAGLLKIAMARGSS